MFWNTHYSVIWGLSSRRYMLRRKKITSVTKLRHLYWHAQFAFHDCLYKFSSWCAYKCFKRKGRYWFWIPAEIPKQPKSFICCCNLMIILCCCFTSVLNLSNSNMANYKWKMFLFCFITLYSHISIIIIFGYTGYTVIFWLIISIVFEYFSSY